MIDFLATRLRHMALIIGMLCLIDCSSSEFSEKNGEPPKEPVPDYKKIISQNFSTIITHPDQYGPFEISGAQQVNSLSGWAWLVCVKGNYADRPIYFSVFIRSASIVDYRANIGIDLCPLQTYEPFSPTTQQKPQQP